MALPGFSVSELIQALSQAKSIYDAFFNEYTNSSLQVRNLASEIGQFRQNLETHREILEKHRLTYSGYDDVKATLDSCNRFLTKYRVILEDRRNSFHGVLKTAKYVFDADEVKKLRNELAIHHQNIMSFSMNLILCVTLSTYRVGADALCRESSLRRQDSLTPVAVSPRPIPNRHHYEDAVSPPPPLSLGSPMLSNAHSPPTYPRRSTSSIKSERPMPPLFEDRQPTSPDLHKITSRQISTSPRALTASPQMRPADQSPWRQSMLSASPEQHYTVRDSQNGSSMPGLVLPQSALPYNVAEV
jgi:hypothetical protein